MHTTSTTVELTAGPVEVHVTGTGDPVLLLHGALADERFWDEVVSGLVSRGHRCVVPTMPLGAHRLPLAGDADKRPPALARLVGELIEVLDLAPATVVANDTSTALTQLLLVQRPDLVRAAVLTNGDAYEHFLPPIFRPVLALPHLPGGMRALGLVLRSKWLSRLPMAFGRLTLKGLSEEQRRRWSTPLRTDPRIRRDMAAALKGVDRRLTLDAASRFGDVQQPILILWGAERTAFPVSLAERLAAELPDSRLALVPGSSAFLPIDAPAAVVQAVDGFIAEVGPRSSRSRTTAVDQVGSVGSVASVHRLRPAGQEGLATG
jgi:pimeloyl-ACP methyl ester carboxylesterase